jgi:2-keto-4-pentenoate hydratase
MEVAQAVDLAWRARDTKRPPAELFKTLTLDQAYQVQLGLLERYRAAGDKVVGWKMGGNSPFGRKMFGDLAPFAGILYASGQHPNGHRFDLAKVPGPALIESELLLVFNKRLEGPKVTDADVRNAIGSVRASFEVAVSQLGAPVDIAQLCADNAAQWGYVIGDELTTDAHMDFRQVRAECWKNGKLYEAGFSHEKVDEQIGGIVWLAGHLHKFGLAIEPGHMVLSGSFLTPCQLAPGDTWKTTFDGKASVSASF